MCASLLVGVSIVVDALFKRGLPYLPSPSPSGLQASHHALSEDRAGQRHIMRSLELHDRDATSEHTERIAERRHTCCVTTANPVIGGDPGSENCRGDVHATHASTDYNPLHFPLMAHPEPMLERSRSFNDDLAWVRIAQDYSLAPPPPPPSSERAGHSGSRSSSAARCGPKPGRCTRRWRGFKNGFLNLAASFVVATSQLANTEALLGCTITIVSVTAYW